MLVALGTACGAFSGADTSTTDPDAGAGTPLEGGTPEGGVAPSPDASPLPVTDANGCVLAATPTLIAPAVGVTHLAANDARVFWADAKELQTASFDDCSTHLIAPGGVTALAADAQWVVWANPTYNAVQSTNVEGTINTNATKMSPSLVLSTSSFWLDPASVVTCATPCANTATELQVDSPSLLAANVSSIFVSGSPSGSGSAIGLYAHTKGTTTPLKLIASESKATLLAATTNHLYWTTATELYAYPLNSLPIQAHFSAPNVVAMAADDNNVFVATKSSITRYPAGGGTPVVVHASGQSVSALALTTNAILWVEQSGIFRMKR